MELSIGNVSFGGVASYPSVFSSSSGEKGPLGRD